MRHRKGVPRLAAYGQSDGEVASTRCARTSDDRRVAYPTVSAPLNIFRSPDTQES